MPTTPKNGSTLMAVQSPMGVIVGVGGGSTYTEPGAAAAPEKSRWKLPSTIELSPPPMPVNRMWNSGAISAGDEIAEVEDCSQGARTSKHPGSIIFVLIRPSCGNRSSSEKLTEQLSLEGSKMISKQT